MSDTIKHECGIAFVRLLKPLDFYLKKYGTPFYGLNKMQILMEKQHNRGQDGAGLANIKLYPKPGYVYINRIRSNDATPIKDIFQRIHQKVEAAVAADPSILKNPTWLRSIWSSPVRSFWGTCATERSAKTTLKTSIRSLAKTTG